MRWKTESNGLPNNNQLEQKMKKVRDETATANNQIIGVSEESQWTVAYAAVQSLLAVMGTGNIRIQMQGSTEAASKMISILVEVS